MHNMEKPAIYGGTPVRETKIYYGHQWIDDDDIRAVEEVMRGDYLTCGPTVTELEKRLCEVTGAKYAVAVANGTAALHCAQIIMNAVYHIILNELKPGFPA